MNTGAGNDYAGLSSQEAAHRLRTDGPNALASEGTRDFLAIFLDALREPLLLLIFVAGILSLTVGDFYEAILLAGLGILNVGLVVYQEHKTERVLESLRDLSSPHAIVIRDGQRTKIPAREVVRGDLLTVVEGDRIAADGRIVSCESLSADESVLTGESVPVRKIAAPDAAVEERPGGDDVPFVFLGTLAVRGHALAEVTATGPRTEMGRIGSSVAQIGFEQTRLRKSTGRLTATVTAIAVLVSLSVGILYGLRTQDWLDAVMAGIAIAISVMPEEIPVVLTVFLTLGAWRIARRNVLTRRAAAIEMLGAATVLCTDKTGTLTVNKMRVSELRVAGQKFEIHESEKLPDAATTLARSAALACPQSPNDPMDLAFLQLVETYDPRPAYALVREYGLTPDLLAVTYVWKDDSGETIVAAKGAPEAIADLCKLEGEVRDDLLREAAEMAKTGLRVLCVAGATHDGGFPQTPRGFSFHYLGMAGLADPVRKTVPDAVKECQTAGIRVVMITGDFPETAIAIARQAGIAVDGGVLTGRQIEALDEDALVERLKSVNVFARILPEQKLRIVVALKRLGEIVAMTGDGVNDAPALKAAHIGIAMGGRGTDVAREAASLVLLDDAFESIVSAIRLGRRIFNNLRKALSYILAIHVPIAGVALVPLLVGWPVVFSVVHIVFLELIIDPVCALAFEAEPEDKDIMERRPRDPDIALFGLREILFSALQGAVALISVLAAFAIAVHWEFSDEEARTVAFVSVVITNIILVLTNRSWTRPTVESLGRPNPILWWVLGLAAALLSAAIYTPVLAKMFEFASPDPIYLALIGGAAALTLVGADALKGLRSFTRRMRESRRAGRHMG